MWAWLAAFWRWLPPRFRPLPDPRDIDALVARNHAAHVQLQATIDAVKQHREAQQHLPDPRYMGGPHG